MSAAASPMTAALAYARRGWHVFPLGADTKGRSADNRSSHLLARGHKAASSEAEVIRDWWTHSPDANIGLSLAASGLVAIDADLYKPDCAWSEISDGKVLPPTFTQASPRGGRHYVFSTDNGVTFPGRLCPGVDIKHHGYILLAPSTFEGKPYEIINDAAPAPCPDWIGALCSAEQPKTGSVTFDRSPACFAEVAELLASIDPDAEGYDAWVETLQALHAHFGGRAEGLELADDWSRGGTKYKTGEVAAKWAGFLPSGGVTIASIAHRARQSGADLREIARRHKAGHALDLGNPSPRPVDRTERPSGSPDLSHDALALALGREEFDANARYVATEDRWYFWTGRHWRGDNRLEHLTRVRSFLRQAANAMAAGKPGKSSASNVKPLKSNATVTAVAALARTNPASATRAEDMDKDLLLLGTPAGTVNLRTGTLRAAERADLITLQTACGPASPGVTPARWLDFLAEVTDGQQEIIDFLQRAAGYALTGSTEEHKLLFLHGTGRNGKSVFLNTLLHIWADYGRRVAASVFLSSQTERHPTDVASLRGARLAVASELPRGKTWDEAVIKDLTGGDRMTARFMRQDFFEFDPQLTLLIAGNVQPSFRGVDAAIRSRVVLVPFTVTIPAERQQKDLAVVLRDEGPAILRWCIDGALAWQRQGLAVPAPLVEASQAYFDEEDIVGQFLIDETIADPQGYSSNADLILRFNQWADLQGLSRWTQRTLIKELKTRGFEDGRTSTSRGLKGLRFK